MKNGLYILDDSAKNILQNSVNLQDQTTNIRKRKINITYNVKQYIEFCATFCLRQLVEDPTRITTDKLSIIRLTLIMNNEKVSEAAIVEITLSNCHLEFCIKTTKKETLNKFWYLTLPSHHLHLSEDVLFWENGNTYVNASVIRKITDLKTGVSRKHSTPNFPKNKHFLPPEFSQKRTLFTYVCVYQGVRKHYRG